MQRIAHAAAFLRQLHGDDGLYEIRILRIPGKGRPYEASGYFRSPDTGSFLAELWDKETPAGIYTTLNELQSRSVCPLGEQDYQVSTCYDRWQ